MTHASERTALYRIRGEADVLVYIGITNSVPFRWNGHQAVQPWWGEVRSLTVEWYETREEAEEAEKAAIRAEQPKYNVTYLKPSRGKGRQGRPGVIPVERGVAVIEPRGDDEDLLNEQDIARMTRLEVGQVLGMLRRTGGPEGFHDRQAARLPQGRDPPVDRRRRGIAARCRMTPRLPSRPRDLRCQDVVRGW